MGYCTTVNLCIIGISLIASFWVNQVESIEFPNQVQGTPTIECNVDNIKMTVDTTQGNPSHIFVKLNPPGVFYRICTVVQLHPQFVTKVDKTFCASCFYMETVKELTQELGVSVLSSTEVAISFPMPQCQYTIRRGSPTGPEIRFATVGEPVYHVWSCPSDSYGMLVQNCYVDDGQGNRILIVDQNGCGVDRYIIQTPEYNNELNMAFQESHVFKFADKTITRFTCQIKVCIKAGGGCEGITPPENCPNIGAGGGFGGSGGGKVSFKQPHFRGRARGRFVRDTSEEGSRILPQSHFNATVPLSELKLADGEDEEELIDVVGELFVLEDIGTGEDKALFEELLNDLSTGEFRRTLKRKDAICVPTTGFAFLITLFAVLIFIGLFTTVFVLLKGRSSYKASVLNKYTKQ